MKSMQFENELFTLTINKIKDGKAQMLLSMNKDVKLEIDKDNFSETIQTIARSVNEFGYDYYLRNIVGDAIRESIVETEQTEEVVTDEAV